MGKWLTAVAVLVMVFGGIFGGKAYRDHQAAAALAGRSYPPVSVSTASARQASWKSTVRVVGTLRAVDGTEITAQLAGNVTQIAFQSGARVEQGQLLVQIDNSTQLATLHSDEARMRQARLDLERARKLFRERAISEQQLQTAEMHHDVMQAAVENDRALLRKLQITAPFSGVLGVREVSLGQYVSPGTGIVSLQRWDPMLLDFALPQHLLGQLRIGQEISFTVDAYPGESFGGRVTAFGSRVDPDTRNVDVQASLANADERLRPGLFGHVALSLDEPLDGIAVPHTAIAYSTFGDTVYVVGNGEEGRKVARARVVQVRAERDGQVLLAAEGLGAGDEVVVAGQNKLRDGAPVTIDNSVQP